MAAQYIDMTDTDRQTDKTDRQTRQTDKTDRQTRQTDKIDRQDRQDRQTRQTDRQVYFIASNMMDPPLPPKGS
jgi:hypothetical protein